MNCSVAYVRFNESGNIYRGCYDNIYKYMYPTLVELDSDFTDADFKLANLPKLKYGMTKQACEVYTPYASGMWWDGVGVEDLHIMLEPTAPKKKELFKPGVPDWLIQADNEVIIIE